MRDNARSCALLNLFQTRHAFAHTAYCAASLTLRVAACVNIDDTINDNNNNNNINNNNNDIINNAACKS